ncbi:MAG: 16S rRNA (adenine(1518)-N(6)/adenine(1519)-N(6))-dimethyltransferase RsmA [Clostridiaceae bacterium]|nr:16S rRNA (adenine(1518)-N(6)/adenine(1519)-N(6))-dimethyltransferase RsmA [Clostridiaceae bacterium]
MEYDTRLLMKKYGIRPYKSCGQNFLADNNIKEKIVSACRTGKDDFVIEIGAGLGTLSRELAARAGRLAAIEADKRLIPALEEALSGYKNVLIINEDVLKLDIKNHVIPMALAYGAANEGNGTCEGNEPCRHGGDTFTPGNIKVVGNLPYYITTPIIMKLLEEEPGIDEAVFMVQKEVADRIVAGPGTKEYGALSIAVRYYAKPKVLFNVPPSAFIPMPQVYSSVIKLVINKKALVMLHDRSLFFKIVRAAFGQRRKTLLNALFNANIFSLGKEEIKQIIASLKVHGIDGDARGEELSMEQFAQLSNAIYKKLSRAYQTLN